MNIAKTEWLKINRYPAFWWVLGLTALSYPGINYGMLFIYKNITEDKKNQAATIFKALVGNPFSFPEVWHTVAYGTSIFLVIPSIVVIMLITNEYTYKTHRQNVIDGWNRKQFMIGKLIDVLILTIILTGLYIIVCLLIGFTNTDAQTKITTANIKYIGLFALQTFAQLSLAFLVGLLVRKSFIALAVFMFYAVIAEPILVRILKYKYQNEIGQYFPMEISNRLIPTPGFFSRFNPQSYQLALDAIQPHVAYTFLMMLVTWGVAFYIFFKRDL